MRTLGFRTHVLLVLAGAAGMLAALARPWYDAAPAPGRGGVRVVGDVQGPLEDLLGGVQRWVTSGSGTTGWDALGGWATALGALAVVSAVCALASLLPGAQGIVREPLRGASLAALAIAAWKLVDSPGPNDALELRLGAFAGTLAALMLAAGGDAVAAAPRRRRVAPARYVAPPPPPAYQPGAGSVPPPGA